MTLLEKISQKEIQEKMAVVIQKLSYLRALPPTETYLKIRDLIDANLKKADITSKISCGSIKNCSFCCHSDIIISNIEADYIKKFVSNPVNTISFNRSRSLKQVETKNNPAASPISWEDKACPLLSELTPEGNRICTIYDQRPIVCRTHNNALSSSPYNCDRSTEPNKTTIDVYILEVVPMSIFLFTVNQDSMAPKKTLSEVLLLSQGPTT